MRIGSNPLKKDLIELTHKPHRIILPFWIPNVEDPYYKNQPEVLRWCLKSLSETVDFNQTNITLVNNNSCREASEVADEFVAKGIIDKYVVLQENRGKLEVILSEARASYEDFITISDADFLFFPGWEQAIAQILNDVPEAGMVTCFPTAHLCYFHNSNLIYARLKTGKIISDRDIELFEQGIGHSTASGLYSRKRLKSKFRSSEKHYFMERKGTRAVVGAVHALATYRRPVVNGFKMGKVPYVFKNGYEHEFIDFAAEKEGYLRLSTPVTYAYHLGNQIPGEIIDLYREISGNNAHKAINGFQVQPVYLKRFLQKLLFPVSEFVFRAARKLKWV